MRSSLVGQKACRHEPLVVSLHRTKKRGPLVVDGRPRHALVRLNGIRAEQIMPSSAYSPAGWSFLCHAQVRLDVIPSPPGSSAPGQARLRLMPGSAATASLTVLLLCHAAGAELAAIVQKQWDFIGRHRLFDHHCYHEVHNPRTIHPGKRSCCLRANTALPLPACPPSPHRLVMPPALHSMHELWTARMRENSESPPRGTGKTTYSAFTISTTLLYTVAT